MKGIRTDENRRFLGTYTAMFAMILAFILVFFRLAHRTFLCLPDGILEHAPALAYVGRWIRDGLSGEGWRMVDFALGQGLDVPTTLMWFCFSDPAAWLSAFFSEGSVEIAYALVLFVRVYFAGVFAALLAMEFDADGWRASLAGVLYAFSSYTFLAAMKHMNFGAGMMFLPLMLFAIERAFQGKMGMYIFVVAIQLIANFYFAYKNTILAIVYIILRLILELRGGREVRDCAKVGFKLLAGYLLGAMLSAVLFLPMLMAFLDSTRTDAAAGYRGSLLHYPLRYYVKLLLAAFQSPQSVGYWVIAGAIPLCAFGMTGLYLSKKKNRAAMKIMPVIVLAMLSIPFIGKLMNGMGYVTNRYTYAIGLFIALGAVLGFEELEERSPRARRWIAVAWLIYACAGLAVLRYRSSMVVLAVFAATAAFLLALPRLRKRLSERWIRAAISLVTVGSICVSFALAFGARPERFIQNFLRPGDADYARTSPMSVFSDADEEGFYRVTSSNNLIEGEDGYYIGVSAALGGINGVAYYWSILPSAVVDCHTDLYLNAQMLSFCVRNLGMDAQLNLLASVKYELEGVDDQDVRMPGYERVEEERFAQQDGYEVLENRYALPMGYTFDHVMSREDYEALDAMEKRDALLRAAILEEDETGLPTAEESALEQLEVRLNGSQGTEAPLQTGETLEISCNVPGEGEVWLLFEATDARASGDTQITLAVCGAEGKNTMAVINPTSNFAFAQKGQIVPMGVYQAGEAVFTVSIENDSKRNAEFSCKEIRAYYRPLRAYEDAAAALGQDVLENVEVSANRVSGTISLDEAKWLQLSIPYSIGWTAEVDGKPATLSKSGVMYMGLMLEPGEHEIVLRYCTPYLKAGAAISAAALLVCLGLAAYGACRRRRKH